MRREWRDLPLVFMLLFALASSASAQTPYMINPATGMPEAAGPSQAAQPGATPAGDWSVFTDPVEHAFSIEVPAGWDVQGGVNRVSAVYVPYWLRAVSPDGGTEIFFGDANVPMYLEPNQALNIAGFHEGTLAPVFGQQLPVQHYRRGEEFAAEWGPARVRQRCAQPVLRSVEPLPDASRSIDLAFANRGVQAEIEAGQAVMSCRLNGAPGVGYVFAATERVASGVADNSIWQVKLLAGFVAAAGQEGRAADLLAHAASSFRIDPNWQAAASQTTVSVSQIVVNVDKVMSASIAQRFAYANRMGDAAHQGEVHAVRGEQTYYDPESQQTFHLDNAAAHYWVGPGHPRPVPTNGSNPPFPGTRELQLVRRQP
jgi:hypothetical protein